MKAKALAAFLVALLLTRLLPIWQPVWAATAYVQSCTGSSADTTTATCIFGSNITAGNTIALFTGEYNGTATVSVTDTLTNTYTAADDNTTYLSAHCGMAYAKSPSGGANTITVTATATPNGINLHAHEISGVHTTTPLDNNQHKAAGNETSGTDAATTGNITTTQNGDYIFAGAVTTGTTWTVGTGFTSRSTKTNAGYGSVKSVSEEQIQSSAGTIAGTFTPGAGADWCVGVMAFQPASVAAVKPRRNLFLGVAGS